MHRILFPLFVFLALTNTAALLTACKAQQPGTNQRFTRQDTLKGSITPERAWWNALKYDITVDPDFDSRTIYGTNVITFVAVTNGRIMQIDLQSPLHIDSVEFNNGQLAFRREGNAWFATFPQEVRKGSTLQLEVHYSGKPRVAKNPPWDGGWIWETDREGKPWMTVACQGIGGSVWYPCKDHQADEPDSATLNIIVPPNLVGVGNGRLARTAIHSGLSGKDGEKTMYTWEVKSPINNYNIVPYIGNYVHWNEIYEGERGQLDMSFYVLGYNEKKARDQFTQAAKMMKCFEYWFGPYPFYTDGYKLVESPHLGMEHQSGIAYGNHFMNGYRGKDLSGTGWGEKWDFILVHESGHEWFGNNITTKDIADMWVHEGFTNYSEVLYTECLFGKQAGNEYCIGLRRNILNDIPVTAPYGVHKEGSGDMYYKASNLVHMIRQIIDDDERFRQLLRGMNSRYRHQTVTAARIEKHISSFTGRNLSSVFDQYVRDIRIPVFKYKLANGILEYRWENCVKGFDMPLKITAERETWLYPTENWKTLPVGATVISVNPNFYVTSKKM